MGNVDIELGLSYDDFSLILSAVNLAIQTTTDPETRFDYTYLHDKLMERYE